MLFAVAVVCVVLTALWGGSPAGNRSLEPEKAAAYIGSTPGLFIVDLRTQREYSLAHIAGAVNIPIQEFYQRMGEIPPGRPVLLYCGFGVRSAYASKVLKKERKGLGKVKYIKGRPVFP